MELLICFAISAVIVGMDSLIRNGFRANKEAYDSAVAFIRQSAAMDKLEAESPRVLIKLRTNSAVTGLAPCQFVTIPDGEYYAWAARRLFVFNSEFEDAVCIAQVQQTWEGSLMHRDVYIRVADYPFLRNFPTASHQLEILSANVALPAEQLGAGQK